METLSPDVLAFLAEHVAHRGLGLPIDIFDEDEILEELLAD